MEIDPEWLKWLAEGGAGAWVLKHIFGPFFDAWTSRGLAAFKERTETKRLLARTEGDAEVERKKKELADDTQALTGVVPDLETRQPVPFVIKVDESLLSNPSSRAWLGDWHRAGTRQRNLEAVVAKMLSSPPPPGDPGEARPSRTWLNRLAEGAGEAEEEDVRERWAKLLAGEIVAPGKFSLRTMDVLRNLSTEEAKVFEMLCDYSLDGGGVICDAFERASRIHYSALIRLDEAGLLKRELSWEFEGQRSDYWEHRAGYLDVILRFYSRRQSHDLLWRTRAHTLTSVGNDLRELNPHHANPEMLRELETIGEGAAIFLEVLDGHALEVGSSGEQEPEVNASQAGESAATKPALALGLQRGSALPAVLEFTTKRYRAVGSARAGVVSFGLDPSSIDTFVSRASRIVWLNLDVLNEGNAVARTAHADFWFEGPDEVVFELREPGPWQLALRLKERRWFEDDSRRSYVEESGKLADGSWHIRQTAMSVGVHQRQVLLGMGIILPETAGADTKIALKYRLADEQGAATEGVMTLHVVHGREEVALAPAEIERRVRSNEHA